MSHGAKEKRKNRVFKWEARLTDEQRSFVEKMYPPLITLAYWCTPRSLRRSRPAVERSFTYGFRTLCRAAQKYDASKSTPMAYTQKIIKRCIYASWRDKNTAQFKFDLHMASENSILSDGSQFALSCDAPDDRPSPEDALANAELCEMALYKVGLYQADFEAVLRLHYGFWYERNGITYAPHRRERTNIAEILGRPESWVKWAICRSLELLRVCLKEHR